MKEIIKLAATFLLIFFIILILFTFFNSLALLIASFSSFSQISTSSLLTIIPYAAFSVLPAALIVSLLIILLNQAVKPAPPFPVVLIFFLTIYAVYTGSLAGFNALLPAASPEKEPDTYFIKNQINKTGSLYLFPVNTTANTLQNVLIIDPRNAAQPLAYYNEIKSVFTNTEIILNINQEKIKSELENSYTRYIYKYDQFSGDILQSFAIFNQDLLSHLKQPVFIFLFSTFAFIFFIFSCGVFTRITRWPLFNLLFFTVLITLFIIVYSFYKTEIYPELTTIIKSKGLLDNLPLFIMTGLGVIFILVDIIFVPRKYWKEGISVD